VVHCESEALVQVTALTQWSTNEQSSQRVGLTVLLFQNPEEQLEHWESNELVQVTAPVQPSTGVHALQTLWPLTIEG
jgi:hypothetical protein